MKTDAERIIELENEISEMKKAIKPFAEAIGAMCELRNEVVIFNALFSRGNFNVTAKDFRRLAACGS